MYSIKKIDGNESSTAKSVNIATEFNEFKDILFNRKTIRHKMKRIQAKKHKIGTYEIDKISLSCFDDKRFVLDNGVHTLPYFHKDCNKKCDKNKNNNHDIDNNNNNKDMHGTFATQFPRFLAAFVASGTFATMWLVLLLRIWYFCDAVGLLLQN